MRLSEKLSSNITPEKQAIAYRFIALSESALRGLLLYSVIDTTNLNIPIVAYAFLSIGALFFTIHPLMKIDERYNVKSSS